MDSPPIYLLPCMTREYPVYSTRLVRSTQPASSDDDKPNVVLNPDFDSPCPDDAVAILHALLAEAESRHARLDRLGTDGVFELQHSNICELGDQACYDRWDATEAILLSGWKLESVVNFVDDIRLIYSGHPVYYLDLVLEFDSSWTPTRAHFDG